MPECELDLRDRAVSVHRRDFRSLVRAAIEAGANPDDAEDIVQDVFLAFFRAVDSLPADTKVRAYLWVAVRNRARSVLAREKFQASRRQQIHAVFIPPPPTAEEARAFYSACRRARQVVQGFSTTRREVWHLWFDEGMEVSAIAARQGISPPTVRWHLHMARREIVRAVMSE